ncbi:beta-lactamase/transpeptidase-like protein [Gonapodya prolifera JEL478]|uniref:Beta-lactamase/transpeptidase-like protein n=1 Tax=Gonapodya prolifera (strain JEL478) TaxID=1344416 RepID=A0A138ZY42_GONPJ|nr:beta-lactamase/transpeptidase-like protein [Gonapodya prolifera JEL478]|eukprot:KXS09410.1 beta-lactamase/transpeptidase-like protein [Gonapodya prolifera JEL478]
MSWRSVVLLGGNLLAFSLLGPVVSVVLQLFAVNPLQFLLLRRTRVYGEAAALFFDYRWTRWRTSKMTDEESQPIWDALHEKNAKRLYKVMTELEGIWIKMGQYVSTRVDILPEAYITELKPLQDALPPRDIADIRQTILEELGSPSEELFHEFNEKPLATASIAQVHKAVLRSTGENIVVKVQHRNIERIVMQDLENMREVVRIVAEFEKDFDFRVIYDEWASELPKELDFVNEASNMETVQRNFEKFTSDLDARDPKLAEEFEVSSPQLKFDCRLPKIVQSVPRSKKVLCLEFVDGWKLNDVKALKSNGVDCPKIAGEICRSYAQQIFHAGVYNGDPHGGNFLVEKSSHRLILLDFGLTKHLTTTERRGLSKMLVAAADLDYIALLSSLEEIGLKLNIDEPEASMNVVRFLFRRSKSKEENQKEMEEMNKKYEEDQASRPTMRKVVEAFPGCLILFGRVLNLLRGLSSSLGDTKSYLEIMTPFARQSLLDDFLRESAVPLSVSNVSMNAAETKLRGVIKTLADQKLVLGMQVFVSRGAETVANVSEGFMGPLDPRKYSEDTLTNVFSVTKPFVAVVLHLLVQDGVLKYDDTVSSVWPSFAQKGKENITVAQALSHLAGLQDAGSDEMMGDLFTLTDWSKVMGFLERAAPKSVGTFGYHYLVYGHLIGGILEKSSGRACMDLVNERVFHPLGIQNDGFIGISPKVESRLASVVMDVKGLIKSFGANFSSIEDLVSKEGVTLKEEPHVVTNGDANGVTNGNGHTAPTPSRPAATTAPARNLRERLASSPGASQALVLSNPSIFNHLRIRRAVIPAANGHFTANALAKFYSSVGAAFAVEGGDKGKDRGNVLGIKSKTAESMMWGFDFAEQWDDKGKAKSARRLVTEEELSVLRASAGVVPAMGGGFFRYHFVKRLPAPKSRPDGAYYVAELIVGLGHSGFGGSVAMALPSENVSFAIVLNKLNLQGKATQTVMDCIAEILDVGHPIQYGGVEAGRTAAVSARAEVFADMEVRMEESLE